MRFFLVFYRNKDVLCHVRPISRNYLIVLVFKECVCVHGVSMGMRNGTYHSKRKRWEDKILAEVPK